MNTTWDHLRRSPVLKRLGRGFVAQGYGHVVGIGLQLATVPILLAVWGEARYGSWLLLSALTTYLALSDLGFAQAATNDMTVSMSTGRTDQTRRTFHSLLALGLLLGGGVILIGTGLAVFFALTNILNLRGVTEVEAKAVTIILAIQVALSILSGGLSGALRAEGRFATMAMVNNSARLAEGLACLAAALVGGGIIGAAIAMLLVRCVNVGAVYGLLLRGAPEFRPSLAEAKLIELQRLAGPSLSFLAFPLGNALMIQGALTLTGLRIPGAVALFATSRTLARLGANVLGSVNHVFLFDYGRTLGHEDRPAFLRLLRFNGLLIGGGLVFYSAAMLLIGPAFYERWTAGRLSLDLVLLLALIALCCTETLWAYVQTPLIAVNAHERVAIGYLIGAATTFGIGAIALGRQLGLEAFIALQAAMYLILAGVVITDLYRRLSQSAGSAA